MADLTLFETVETPFCSRGVRVRMPAGGAHASSLRAQVRVVGYYDQPLEIRQKLSITNGLVSCPPPPALRRTSFVPSHRLAPN